jgi:hypothetical protein
LSYKERTLESVARIATILNSQFDGKEVSISEKHRESCEHILNESILSTLSESDLEGTDSDKKDMTLFFYLVRVKCLEIEGQKPLNFTSPYFKSNIFFIDDEAECVDRINECSNDYLGLLIVQFFKMFIRRMEVVDLRRTFCIDYRDALWKVADDAQELVELKTNFTEEFCDKNTSAQRRDSLKLKLIRLFEDYFGRMNSNELYASICRHIIRANSDGDGGNNNRTNSNTQQFQSYYELGIRIVGSCKLQVEKKSKWTPRNSGLFERLKSHFDLYSKQLEEKYKSLSKSLQEQYESLRGKLLNLRANETKH